MPFRRVPALVAVAICTTLTACTDAAPKPTPTTTPTLMSTTAATTRTEAATATPTPTRTGPLTTGPNTRPGESPPTFPTEATKHDLTGALDFAFYFFKALDWSIATNDSWLLQLTASKRCAPCSTTIHDIDDIDGRHQTLRGGRISIVAWGLASGNFTVPSEQVVRVKTNTGAETIVDTNGAIVRQYDASSDTSLVFLNWVGTRWQVVDLGGDI